MDIRLEIGKGEVNVWGWGQGLVGRLERDLDQEGLLVHTPILNIDCQVNSNHMKGISLSLKPNSLQTIFHTDFLRRPTIEESVVIDRFFKYKIGWCDMKISWARHQRFFWVKVGRFSHRFSPTIIIKHV